MQLISISLSHDAHSSALPLKFLSTLKNLLLAGLLGLPASVAMAQVVSGNIQPYSIEMDGDLWPTNGVLRVDWVMDTLPNTDTPTLIDSIAAGITNTTGAPNGKGHWRGVRIVDGIGTADQDIFIKGGKENDTNTWIIGPGSVGSSKYDISQAYLANNQTQLFFGMERRGNNGTTAFDFEFNQLPPLSTYIPNRTVKDVLFTFEMNGSGSSGSAVPHYFVWSGSAYVESNPPPSSLVSKINNNPIPAAPWGFVNSKGVWTLGNLDNFEFAEASVVLTQAFPGFSVCGNTAYVQVRTRSSATDTSDLKDTTTIFPFKFGGSSAVAEYQPNCFAQFTYDGTKSTDSSGVSSNLTYAWDFAAPAGIALDAYHSTSPTGIVTVIFPAGWNGDPVVITNTLTVTDAFGCSDQEGPAQVTVYPVLTPTYIKTQNRTNLTAILKGSAPGATSLQWQIQQASGWSNIANATNATLTYSSFEQDSGSVFPIAQPFTLGTGTAFYEGFVYEVSFRLHAVRVAGGLTCAADSAPQTVRKLVAVDP